MTELELAPDGRILHRLRQSDLGDYDKCLEYARRKWQKLVPRWETDAASMGTAIHGAIETTIQDQIDHGSPLPEDQAVHIAQGIFSEQMAHEQFRWIQVKEGGARKFIDRAVGAFYEEVLPTLDPLHVEARFGTALDGDRAALGGALTFYEDDERVIQFTGTMDYVDRQSPSIKDWKSASNKYEAWEYQRWAPQPTVYLWAAIELGLVDPDLPSWEFEYVVFIRGATVKVQRITVTRHRGDFDWMRAKCLEIARLREAQLPRWPLGDAGWWCSSKWCPAWDDCKGATRNHALEKPY